MDILAPNLVNRINADVHAAVAGSGKIVRKRAPKAASPNERK